MAKHVFVVLTNSVEGQEDAFNEWYDNTHLGDVLRVPGFLSAQRFKLSDAQWSDPPFPCRYLALYEIETDDPAATMAELKARSGTSQMVLSSALSPDFLAWMFQPVTPRVEAP